MMTKSDAWTLGWRDAFFHYAPRHRPCGPQGPVDLDLCRLYEQGYIIGCLDRKSYIKGPSAPSSPKDSPTS